MRRILEPTTLTAIGLLFPFYAIYWYFGNISYSVAAVTIIVSLLMGSVNSIFAHRAWTHKAWIPSPIVNIVGLFLFTIMLTGPSVAWVAIHRKHHRYEDTPEDPHSPYYQSWFGAHYLSYFANVNVLRYAPDIIRQRTHMWFAAHYWTINIVWLTLLYVISPWLLSFWIAYTGLNLFKQHTVNSLLHASPWWIFPINYTNGAANSFVHNILMFGNGESWHANHHNDPYNWRFGKRWYEVDLGAVMINCLIKLKLGTDRHEDNRDIPTPP